jgi:shikimate kinase
MVLVRRIAADPASIDNRPPLSAQGGGIEEIERVLGEREPVYRSLASFELDVTNLSVEEAVVYLTRMI